jgi:phosphonoacetaldehyde hydrolase
MDKIRAVILDWAGTTVDFGCFAPVKAFADAFNVFGIEPSIEECRAPMGLPKRAHIAKMLEGERISALWRKRYGKTPTADSIDKIYKRFEIDLFRVLEKHAEPLPGVLETVHELRCMGMLLGSTTGYTKEMMDVVAPRAATSGYAPDCLVCPEDARGIGRPYPYMLWRNLEKLGIQSIDEAIKVGDTEADIQEGKNAGCLAVGVLKGSSVLGLDEMQLFSLSDVERASMYVDVRCKYKSAGADYVLEDITGLIKLMEQLDGGDL